MEFCEQDGLTQAELVEKCRRIRDELSERMMITYPEFEGQPPAYWVEDLIASICGYRVGEYSLPKGQLGLCDVSNRLILINSEIASFVESTVDITCLKRSTLGHELGHVCLHGGEFQGRFTTKYGRWAQSRDARWIQRENEADVFAAVFMVPGEMLVGHARGREIYDAWRAQRQFRPAWLERLVRELAADFGVTFSLMRRSLMMRKLVVMEGKKLAIGFKPIRN